MADPYSQLPGTMIVGGTPQDPWESAFSSYQQAIVDLNGDGVPDAAQQPRLSDAARRRSTVAAIDPVEPAPGREAGIAEALMIPGAPVRTILGGLGAAYGIAAGRDMGIFGSDATAQSTRKRQVATSPAQSLPGLTPEQVSEYGIIQSKMQRGDFGSSADRRAAESRSRELRALSDEFSRGQNALARDEYSGAVRRAETARDLELQRNRRFSDTATGQLWEKSGGAAPVLAGAAAGFLGRVASGGGNALKNYVMPAAEGALAGMTAANIPLAYNALFTEPDNPERRAYEAYSRELPPSHPRKEEWANYAQSLPQANPVREQANRELFDPMQAAERVMFGGLEGAGGGLLGAAGARIPGALIDRTAAMPDRIRNATSNGSANVQSTSRTPSPPEVQTTTPPPQPVVYSTYPSLPSSAREPVQQAYILDRISRGGNLPSKDGAQAIKNSLYAQGIDIPVTPNRIANTNAQAGPLIDAFIKSTGRVPTPAEFASFFNERTLAVPLVAAGAAINALGYYGGDY